LTQYYTADQSPGIKN